MIQLSTQFFNPKILGRAAIVLALLVGGWLVYRWQPERQIERHQAALLEALGDRNWKRVNRLLAPDFRLRTGHDREWLIREGREVLRQFIALEIKPVDPVLERPEPDKGTVRSRLQVKGSGSPIAQHARDAVNNDPEPFLFVWKHQSWKPWDWQLMTIDHPLMDRASYTLP